MSVEANAVLIPLGPGLRPDWRVVGRSRTMYEFRGGPLDGHNVASSVPFVRVTCDGGEYVPGSAGGPGLVWTPQTERQDEHVRE